MKVAFWSNVHGQTTTTSNALAISIVLALTKNNKVLLTHNHYHHSTLEHTLLGVRDSNPHMDEFDDSGIDAVSRMIKYDNVDGSCIQNYSTTMIKNRLDFLEGTRQANEDFYYNDLDNVIELILSNAKSIYDFMMIDLSAGVGNLSGKILKSSDLIVVNLNQNAYVLDNYFKNHSEVHDNKIFIISRYDEKSKYTIRYIKQKYNIKDPIISIPYSINYSDAINQGRAIDFIARNLKAEKADENYNFIKQIVTVSERIIKIMEESTGLRETG